MPCLPSDLSWRVVPSPFCSGVINTCHQVGGSWRVSPSLLFVVLSAHAACFFRPPRPTALWRLFRSQKCPPSHQFGPNPRSISIFPCPRLGGLNLRPPFLCWPWAAARKHVGRSRPYQLSPRLTIPVWLGPLTRGEAVIHITTLPVGGPPGVGAIAFVLPGVKRVAAGA